MGRGGLALLALAIVALLAGCGNMRAAGTQTPGTHAAPAASLPAGWHLYRDPYGFFTIGLPPGWAAQTTPPSTGTVGDRQGSGTMTGYLVGLGNSHFDPTGLTVDVSYYPLSNRILRSWSCQSMAQRAPGTPTTRPYFAGLNWFVETNAAHYQIGYFLNNRSEALMSPATPIPQAKQEADTLLFAQLLATFTPIPNTPLQC